MNRQTPSSWMWAFFALAAAILACSFEDINPEKPAASPIIAASETVTFTPEPAASATASLSVVPSDTPIPTEIPTSTITPTQVLPGVRFPETPIPVMREMVYPEGQTRIMLVIVDNSTPNSPRADSIHLIGLNTLHETASILSIPSSLYVNIPNVGMERIYSSLIFGGPGKLLDTIEYNLGIRANRFIAVDFEHFGQLVDNLGPINVPVGAQLSSPCNLPVAVSGRCNVFPGLIQMDKDLTLWYLRERSGGEKDRMRRSQEVLLAFFNRLMDTQAPARLGELSTLFRENMETDITEEDVVNLTPVSVAVYTNGRIRRTAMGDTEAVPFNLPDGQNVLLLDQNAAWNLTQQSFFQP